jgi:hypothetical protein
MAPTMHRGYRDIDVYEKDTHTTGLGDLDRGSPMTLITHKPHVLTYDGARYSVPLEFKHDF